MRGCRLPVHSVKRDGSGDEGFKQMRQYLEGNEKWLARNAMIGFISGAVIHVLKPRGPQKYIHYSQTNDNKFAFPPLEAIALVLSKRLIVFGRMNSQIVPLSAHFLLHHATSMRFPMRSVFHYAMFSRFALCSRRRDPISSSHQQSKTTNYIGFAAKVVAARALGPTRQPNFSASLFPPTHFVKIPSHHNLQDSATLSIPGFPRVDPDTPVIAPVSFKCIVKTAPGPGENAYILKFT